MRFLGNRDDHVCLRPADRPGRRVAGDAARRTRRSSVSPSSGSPNSTSKYGRSFFLFHRPRRWNPEERVWMGYERKRGKLADLNALLRGRANGRFSRVVGDTGDPPAGEVRHHARRRHAAAAGRRPPPGRRHDAPAQPRAVRRARAARDRGIRHPAAARGRQPPRREPVAVRAAVGQRARHRSVHPRRVRRLPGPVRRRLLHRQGHLRRRCVRPGGGRPLPGEPDPQPRPARRLLRARRAADRRAGVRGVPLPLRRGRAAAVPLDPRRLAAVALAAAGRARTATGGAAGTRFPRSADGSSSTTCAAASRPRRWWACSSWRGPCCRPPGPGRSSASAACCSPPWSRRSPASSGNRPTCGSAGISRPARARLARQVAQALLTLACLPYEACFSLDAALRTVGADCSSRAGACSSGRRRAIGRTPPRQGLAGAWARMWIAPALAVAACAYLCARPAGQPRRRRAHPAPLVRRPGHHLADQPSARRGAAARLTADQLRFLRGVARRTWGFFDTYVGPDDHWLPPDNYQESPAPAWRTARRRPTWDWRCSPISRPTTSATSRPAGSWTAPRARSRRCRRWSATAATSTTGTTPQSLAPLEPRYISSVDSGNLAGHLLTLRPGLLALADEPILPPRDLPGAARHVRPRGRRQSGRADGRHDAAAEGARRGVRVPAADDRGRPADPRAPRRGEPRAGGRARDLGRARGAAGGPRRWPTSAGTSCDDLACLAPWTSLGGLGHAAGAPPRVHRRSRRSASWRRSTASGAARPGRGSRRSTASRRRRSTSPRWSGSFLFDRTRQLLSIGYNVAERRRDSSYYDLLASEARLCTFVAIAQGHLPQESWFALGRLLTTAAGEPVLLSWSGSMFEYLMPLVVMPGYEDTLLDQTCKAAVKRQIEYGRHRGVPWGISESGYNLLDVAAHLPVPRVRRAGPRPQARPRRRSRRRAVRVGPRADGVARGGVREPAAARGGGLRGRARLLRGDRLHAGAPAARPPARRRALLHGASPGDDVPVAGARAPRRPHAGALRVRPGVPGDRAAAPGADPARERVLPAGRRPRRTPARRRPAPTSRCARSADPTRPRPRCSCCRTAGTTSWSPTRAAGTADGRTSPSPAGARTRPRTTGGRSATSGTSRPARSGPRRTSRRCSRPIGSRRCSPRPAPSSAAGRTRSRATPRSPCRPRTTSSCAGCA